MSIFYNISKANKILALIFKTFTFIDKDIFVTLFKTLVRLHLEYASPTWSPLYKKDKIAIENVQHTCDSTAGSRKIPFIKPVCRSTVPVDQTTVFENFRKYYENPIKSVPISLFRHAPV